MSNDGSTNHPWGGGDGTDPLAGPDGQPLLAEVGDLGDTLVTGGGGISNSGTISAAPISPISSSSSNLTINVTYDQSAGSLPSGFVNAINYVVSYYESLFTVAAPTTVNIDVGYGEIGGQGLGSNALGESETFLAGYSYSQIKSALTASDPSAAASLPATQPVSGTMWVGTAEAKALELTPSQPTSDIDGYAGFSSTLPFTYDPSNRAVAGAYDFIGVVEHEFSEVMGRIDLFNATLSDGTTTIPNAYSLLDMFHYTSSGVHTYTGTTTNYFSANGGATNLDYFNSNSSGDLGDWAGSAGADAYLAFSPSGEANQVTPADIAEMNALGYESVLLTPVVVESSGSTALVEVGDNYFMNPAGGGAGVELAYNGTPVVAGTLSGWTAIGAEATASGYEVAWKMTGQDLYTVWNTDSSGHYTSNAVGAVSGSDSGLEALETSFHQDLNGDGTIGPVQTTIESAGSTALVEVGDNYFMNPAGGGSGVELAYNGTPVVAGTLSGWTAIGAEATASGYEVAWKMTGQDLYTVWNTDSSGHYTSNAVGAVSGSDSGLEALETSFHQDLNGDGTIGPVQTTIESAGSTALVEVGDNYFMNPAGGGAGVELAYNGTPVVAGTLSGWTAIGAEATASGYEVAWKMTGQDLYTVWNTDSSGHYTSNATIGAVSGSDSGLEALETSFHQDLNGDGTIGPVQTTIESAGSTALVEVGNNYFMNPAGRGSGVELAYNGAHVVAGTLSGWTAIGAEATASGYEVAWKMTGQDLYTVWNTDSSGHYTSNAVGAVSGSDSGLEALETSFHQDLNGDGTIGVPPPPSHDLV